LERLGGEFAETGKLGQFELFKERLTGEAGRRPYRELSSELHMSEGAARAAVLRMRRRFADLLRDEIAETVSRPEEVEEELRYMRAVLARR
jgi:RNA polymerase sigma-70 factor (ECF subfamily)